MTPIQASGKKNESFVRDNVKNKRKKVKTNIDFADLVGKIFYGIILADTIQRTGP